ncbi:hypothetical protein A9Q91_04380 [Candidatus Gracilibacteria bacterium 28_42_T64]|nr:hypothetical protein A9Q91_04380 [Candidatus Gracilibacteria bacterium 28_42_T64]
MGLPNGPSFETGNTDTNRKSIKASTQKETGEIDLEIKHDQETILYLTYLTTLARLPENRDLDELFDGEVELGEEELMAIYSLVEVINGKNTITSLKTPKKMNLDRNWAQDYEYDFSYEDIEGNGVKGRRIKAITGDGFLPANETKLNFNYGKGNEIDNILFERPTNLDLEGGGFGVDQEISFERENGLVTNMRLSRDLEVDNKLSITYNSINKPEIIEQTKLGMGSDKILFEYDENGDLKTILYLPVLSLKHLKGGNKTIQKYHRGTGFRRAKNLGELVINGVTTTFGAIKRLDSCDTIEFTNKNGLPISTKTQLNSSRWFYENGFSRGEYNDEGELMELYLEKEEIGPDDKKTITLKY